MLFIKIRCAMYNHFKTNAKLFCEKYAPLLWIYAMRHKVFIKYIIAGGTAAVINLSCLYLFTEYANLLYVYSSMISYSIGVLLAFMLQKFWTFRDGDLSRLRRQFTLYAIVAVVNFFLNPIILAFLVELVGWWYMVSQTITLFILAVISFVINKTVTFRKSNDQAE